MSEIHQLSRIQKAVIGDLSNFHFRMVLINCLVFFMPHFCFNRLRTIFYKWAGVKIGKGSLVLGSMEISGQGKPWAKLHIGENCQITSPFYADLNDTITIGNHVAIGHHTIMITMNHDFSWENKRCGAGSLAPIIIEDGVWLGARVTVLPGVTIGKGSVIAAGAVVNKNVPPNCLVGGIPARVIKSLNHSPALNNSEKSNEKALSENL